MDRFCPFRQLNLKNSLNMFIPGMLPKATFAVDAWRLRDLEKFIDPFDFEIDRATHTH